MQVGDQIGRFTITGKIGSGGMGEVYLAHDPELNRNAAIKILSRGLSDDPDKLNRFLQEARAASALSHPNIVTVYEIGEWEGDRYIALEHVEGVTLGEFAVSRDLDLKSAIELALQIASALDAAHAAGIIHRDIKPDNAMVRSDGLVKVLDFGIAKLTERQSGNAESEAKTELKVNTSPGMILGTASYMSPEQAKAKDVDYRSDIFSFGVLLYELISGRLPFKGESVMEMIGSILRDEPAPLPREVPDDLARIIKKALRKDPDERYQTMKGLIADLKHFLRETGGEGRIPSRTYPDEDRETRIVDPNTKGDGSPETGVTGAVRRKPLAGIAIIAVIALVAAVSAFSYFYFSSPARMPFSNIEMTEVRSGRFVEYPVISPDGKLAAFVRIGDANKGELAIRQVESGEEAVIHKAEYFMRVENFSHDGQHIYFTESPGRTSTTLYKISTLGGAKRKVTAGRGIHRVSASPDGKSIVFREHVDGAGPVISVAGPNGEQKTEVLKLSDLGVEDTFLGGWAPDSRRLLIAIFPEAANEVSSPKGVRTQLALFDTREDGRSRKERVEIFDDGVWEDIASSMSFLPDGSGAVILAQERGSRTQLWRVGYPGGETVPITNDDSEYLALSLSADGKTLLTATATDLASLWSVDPASGEATQVMAEDPSVDGYSISGTEEGRIFFFKVTSRGSTILSVNEEGKDEKEHFTVPERLRVARVTPDGRYIIAVSWSADSIADRLVRFDLDGGGRLDLTKATNAGDYQPALTGDGRILFERVPYGSAERRKLRIVSIDGTGERDIIGLGPAIEYFSPTVSPDGRLLAFLAEMQGEEPGGRKYVLRIVDFKDDETSGSQERSATFETESTFPRIRWWPDSSAIVVEDGSNPNSELIKISIPDGVRRQVSKFRIESDTGDFLWNSAGDRLLVFRVTSLSKIIAIRDRED